MKQFFDRNKILIGSLVFLIVYSIALISFATPPTSPYLPGETLDPACIPGSSNCTTTPFNIGQTIGNSPTNGSILFVSTSGTVGQDSNFNYDDSTVKITVGNINLFAESATVGIVNFLTERLHSYGTSNEFWGVSAGNFTLTGSNNIGIGTNTGLALTTGSGNVCVGQQTCQALTIGGNNIFFGKKTGESHVSGDRNILIGYDLDSPGGTTASDTLNIGNTLYGDLSTGRIGIGDTTADDLLNIHSASAESGLAITSLGTDTDALIKFELADGTPTFTMGVDDSDSDKFKISTTALGTSDRLIIDSSGNVGLDVSPTARLHVKGAGATSSTSSLLLTNSSGTVYEQFRDDGAWSIGRHGCSGGDQSTLSTGVSINSYMASGGIGISGCINGGTGATAIGASVNGTYAIGIGGYNASATGQASIAIGMNTVTTLDNTIMIGTNYETSLINTLSASVAFGTGYTTAVGTSYARPSVYFQRDSGMILPQYRTMATTDFDRLAGNAINSYIYNPYTSTITVSSVTNDSGRASFVGNGSGNIQVGEEVTISGFTSYTNGTYYVAGYGFLATTRANAFAGTPVVSYVANDTGTMVVHNRRPVNGFTDLVSYYPDDIAAGKASPHWITEDGYVLSLGSEFGTQSNNDLSLTANSTVGATLQASTGYFGIGDTTPDDLLNIHSASAQSGIAITSLGTDTDALIKFELADGTPTFTMGVDDSDSDKFKISTTALGTSDRLIIDSSGNIGVGISIPTSKLYVLSSDNVSTTNIASFVANNGTYGTAIGYGGIYTISSNVNENMNIAAKGAGDILLGTVSEGTSSTGDVGIGTTTPAYKLTISDQSSATVQQRFYNSATGTTSTDGFDFGITSADATFWNFENGYIGFATNNTERFRILSGGNAYFKNNLTVGSTDTAVATLDVRGAGVNAEVYNTTDGGNTDFYYSGDTGAGAGKYFIQRMVGNDATNGALYLLANSTTTSTSLFTVLSSGSVGVGDYTPDYLFDIEKTSVDTDIFALTDSDGACLHNPESGSETVTCSSDERLKTNISDANPMLPYLNGLVIRQYDVIASGDHLTGVIAQEIQSIHPELVTVGPDGYLSVASPNTWQLIKAIQELDIKIRPLEDLLTEDNSIAEAIRIFLANSTNKITRIFTGEICLSEEGYDSECINREELHSLKQLLQNQNNTSGSSGGDNTSGTSGDGTTGEDTGGTGDIPDTTAPVITLIGDPTITLSIGDTYEEQGATAIDDVDGDITSNIQISGTVDTSISGIYTIYYDVSDNAGNQSQISREIVVS